MKKSKTEYEVEDGGVMIRETMNKISSIDEYHHKANQEYLQM
ncbi:MAG TPA: hypothetical protein VE130_11485 [Nitrososphaeraceae archaeon]|nr:hypothetical protein [Nitrososphaeraceae archaeon]